MVAAMATYYIDPDDGSDTNSGLSPNPAAGAGGPWKTVAKAASTVAAAGDQFLIKRGTVIREPGSVFFWTAGTQQLPITLGAYGVGPRPDRKSVV